VQDGCAIFSYKSALDRLNALERKGLIRRMPNKHRGIRVVRRRVEEAALADALDRTASPDAEAPEPACES